MGITRIFLVLGLGLTLLVGNATAGAKRGKGGKGAKKHHAVHGVVVKMDKDKVNGTITIRVHHKKDGDATAKEEEKTFRITDLTKFEKIIIKGKGKDERERKPASFADLQLGKHVLIVPAANTSEARAVAIVEGHKKKKA